MGKTIKISRLKKTKDIKRLSIRRRNNMKLEHQICSLELAKKLKELGVKQESLWAFNPKGFPFSKGESEKWGDQWISSFTVAELGEMLPMYFEKGENKKTEEAYIWWFETIKSSNESEDWMICYECEEIYDAVAEHALTEADARAKMLIYLLENKLI